jgi:hypothetical protein
MPLTQNPRENKVIKIKKAIIVTTACGVALLGGIALSGRVYAVAPQSEAKTVTNPIFPATFSTPQGWKLANTQDNNSALVPASKTPSALLLVHHGVYKKKETLILGLIESLKTLSCQNIRITSEGEKTFGGKSGYTARGTAQNAKGEEIELGICLVLSGKELGTGILFIANPGEGDGAMNAAHSILSGVKFGSFAPLAAKQKALVGAWAGGSSQGTSRSSGPGSANFSSSASYTFGSDGTFVSSYKSIISASGVSGDFGSSLSSGDEEPTRDTGRYYVVGKKLILVSSTKGTQVLDYVQEGNLLKVGTLVYRR